MNLRTHFAFCFGRHTYFHFNCVFTQLKRMANFFGLTKIKKLIDIVKFHGGPVRAAIDFVSVKRAGVIPTAGAKKQFSSFQKDSTPLKNLSTGDLLITYSPYTKEESKHDDLKKGQLVGEDVLGNKYYENNSYFYGRNRWVIYADKFGYDYDGSQIPAEWYGWLHYKTDKLPHEDPSRPKHKWMAVHTENFTGTREQYVPYSTTKPKIEAWVPPKK